jgi:hypothetical protein
VKAILLLLIALAVPAAVSAQDDRLRICGVAVERTGADRSTTRCALRVPEIDRRQERRRAIIAARDPRLAPGVALLMTELARRDSRAGGPGGWHWPRRSSRACAATARHEGLSGALVCVCRLPVDRRLRIHPAPAP